MLLVTYQDVCRFYRRDFWGAIKAHFSYGSKLTKFIYKRKGRRRRRRRGKLLRRRHRTRRRRRWFKLLGRRIKRLRLRRLRRRLRRRRGRFCRYRRRRRRPRIYSNRFELLKLDNRRYVRKKRLPKNAFRLHNKEKLRLYFLNFSEHAFRYYLVTLLKSHKNLTKLVSVFEHFGSRLDHLLYLTGLASTIFQSRELLFRGCIMVNGRVARLPRFVPRRGSVIRISPWKLNFWKKLRRARIRILYKNFLGRLKIRLNVRRHFYKMFYKRSHISRKITLRRWRIKYLRFPRNLIYAGRRHYRKAFFSKRRLRLRLAFLISVCLRQTIVSLKRLVVLGILVNACVARGEFMNDDEVVRPLYYIYYSRLMVTSKLLRVYVKLLRRIARRFKISFQKRLSLQFLKALFLRRSPSASVFRRTLTFDPWFDLGVVSLPSSGRFLYFWALREKQLQPKISAHRFRNEVYSDYYKDRFFCGKKKNNGSCS